MHITIADELLRSLDLEALGRFSSASSSSLIVRRTQLSTVGDQTFPVFSAPPPSRVWNELPRDVTSAQSPPWVFGSHLTTHLFSRSFPDFL